jgi:hypothetical protein
MGRNPTLQLIARLMLLAPDWTESNFRTVTGMLPGANDKISKLIGDVAPPAGMDALYRKFWARVMLRIAVSTIIAQLLLNGKDDTEKFYKEQAASNRWNKFRWTEIDISTLYKALGIDTEGQKKTFSLGGHFFDPLKLLDPLRLIKGKASPFMRSMGAAFSGRDWADRPFAGTAELVATGKTVKKNPYEPVESGFNRLPAVVVNQAVNMQPIQMGQLLRYLAGEEDGLSALLHSAGVHVATAWASLSTGPIEAGSDYPAVAAELSRLEKTGALKMGPPARRITIGGVTQQLDAGAYADYVQRSSRAAAARLSQLFKAPGYTNWSEDKKAAKVRAIIENARQRVRKKVKRKMRTSSHLMAAAD